MQFFECVEVTTNCNGFWQTGNEAVDGSGSARESNQSVRLAAEQVAVQESSRFNGPASACRKIPAAHARGRKSWSPPAWLTETGSQMQW